MVAYGFKKQFVPPIRIGLGLPHIEGFAPTVEQKTPKRQTVRAWGKKPSRHAKEGQDLQLYYAMRTRQCRLIGKARCVGRKRIIIWVGIDAVLVIQVDAKLLGPRQANEFARRDGFGGIMEMGLFWLEQHGAGKFEGVVIMWEPIT